MVCNADEGDSGTFADRMLMEGDPFALIEGMAIAAHAVGAGEGYIYIRSEYPFAVTTMRAAIEFSGQVVAPLRLEVRVGAGAYVCGEETAMLTLHRRQVRGCAPAAAAGPSRSVRGPDGDQQCPRPSPPRRSSSIERETYAAPRPWATLAAGPCQCSWRGTSGTGGLFEAPFGINWVNWSP